MAIRTGLLDEARELAYKLWGNGDILGRDTILELVAYAGKTTWEKELERIQKKGNREATS